MKLQDLNKADNRLFHELEISQRVPFLLKALREVFPVEESDKGEFTPVPLSPSLLNAYHQSDPLSPNAFRPPVDVVRAIGEAFVGSAAKLNFLMTRLHLERDPQFDDQIKSLVLLRFEYLLATNGDSYTHDPKLVIDFFQKREKPELIAPILRGMAEEALKYNFLAKKILHHPLLPEYLGEHEITLLKFRARLHSLAEDDLSKEKIALTLLEEGFDLESYDFNLRYAAEKDYKIANGSKPYTPAPNDTRWLAQLISNHRRGGIQAEEASPGSLLEKAETEPEESRESIKCSKEALQGLDREVQRCVENTLVTDEDYWLRQLAPLTEDHGALDLSTTNLVEAKLWQRLWGGDFAALAYQLKGADPTGPTRRGLNYALWAISSDQHGESIDPILAQAAYAMILAGDILVGDLSATKDHFEDPALQKFKNPGKIQAAVNLAWEKMQHPGESDRPDKYTPPYGYLFTVAKYFSEQLEKTPSARPYFTLARATSLSELGEAERKILSSIRGPNHAAQLGEQLGVPETIKGRLLLLLEKRFAKDAEFMILYSDVSGISNMIENPLFRQHVADQEISDTLIQCTGKILNKNSKKGREGSASGSKKFVLTMYANPVLRPFLEGRIDIATMVNGMIDDEIHADRGLLTTPYSLRGSYEITISNSPHLEAYALASKYREYADPERMKRLVAYLLTIGSDFSVNNRIDLGEWEKEIWGTERESINNNPDCLAADDAVAGSNVPFISEVYRRELEQGMIDGDLASTGVTNVIFRGLYVEPNRFFPRLDPILEFLDSPASTLLSREDLGGDAIREFEILHEFLKRS